MVKVAILCGGIGSRLWPLSRKEKPKQFMKLPDAQFNLFQETILRINHLKIKCSELIIVSNIELMDEISDCINNLPIDCPITFIWEPIMKNTGAAIGSLINYLSSPMNSTPNDDHCLVWPSDHLLCVDTFNKSLEAADQYLENSIITFGICPTYPETGYGYINAGEEYKIDQFIEKPAYDRAQSLIKNTKCYWNSGMFYFKTSVLLNEYRERGNQLFDLVCQSFKSFENKGQYNHIHIDKDIYNKCQEIPFDKLIMEKTNKGRVIPFNGRWSDIGSWDSLSKLNIEESHNNVILLDNRNCHIYNYNDKQIISAIGLSNVCVINTSDALLISDLSQTQKVKTIYQQLENIHSMSVQRHIKNEHSWGISEQLDPNSQSHKVIKFVINEKMSLPQRYQKNKLMYIIPVSGDGSLIIETVENKLINHQLTYIPVDTYYNIMNQSTTEKLVIFAFKFI